MHRSRRAPLAAFQHHEATGAEMTAARRSRHQGLAFEARHADRACDAVFGQGRSTLQHHAHQLKCRRLGQAACHAASKLGAERAHIDEFERLGVWQGRGVSRQVSGRSQPIGTA